MLQTWIGLLFLVPLFLFGCNSMSEPAPIDQKDEPGEYRARVRESVQERIGVKGEPIKDRNKLVGDWDVSYDHWFEKLPPKQVFVYHMHADGTLLIETLGDQVFREAGCWRFKSDSTFSQIFSFPPNPEVSGLEDGATDETRYHLLRLMDGRLVMWNGDASLILLFSMRQTNELPR
jgi:hypothetical protein